MASGYQVQRKDLTDHEYRHLADNVFPLLIDLKRKARARLAENKVSPQA